MFPATMFLQIVCVISGFLLGMWCAISLLQLLPSPSSRRERDEKMFDRQLDEIRNDVNMNTQEKNEQKTASKKQCSNHREKEIGHQDDRHEAIGTVTNQEHKKSLRDRIKKDDSWIASSHEDDTNTIISNMRRSQDRSYRYIKKKTEKE